MTIEEMQAAYRVLPASAQRVLLAHLAHELTVSARGYYSARPQRVNSEAGSPVGSINEMLHQVSSQLRALLTDDEWRRPDDTLIAALAFWAEHGGNLPDLEWSFEQALSRTERPPS
jgi:hypothetical protein